MICKLNKNLLYTYSDKSIDPVEKIFLEEHLKYCEECNKDLRIINLVDSNLLNDEKSIHFPEKLSIMSELVAENCIAREEEINSRLKIHNHFKNMKNMGRIIFESQKLSRQNPYNQFIKRNTKITKQVIGKSIRNYYKKKISGISLFNLLKVG